MKEVQFLKTLEFEPILKVLLFFITLIFTPVINHAQAIYKTPTGTKYHLASCRMVENVSEKIKHPEFSGLQPCKICKPPAIQNLKSSLSDENKSVGTSKGKRCKGITQKGTHCKHYTKMANGYCFQHTAQNSSAQSNFSSYPKSKSSTSSRCGARTSKGGQCKRKVKGGGYCYQHRNRQ